MFVKKINTIIRKWGWGQCDVRMVDSDLMEFTLYILYRYLTSEEGDIQGKTILLTKFVKLKFFEIE